MRTRRLGSCAGFLATIQNIIDVAAARPYLSTLIRAEPKMIERSDRRPSAVKDIPSEDILRMSIAQVDFGNSPDGDTLCLAVEELAIIQVCGRHVNCLVGKGGDGDIGFDEGPAIGQRLSSRDRGDPPIVSSTQTG